MGKDFNNSIELRSLFSLVWDKLQLWLINIVLILMLWISTSNFMSTTNLINVIRQISVNGIIALGATFVILAGEIDLSQGPLVALIGCICAKLMAEAGINIVLAILISMLIGTFIGLLSGLIISYLHVESFITTLGVQYSLLGVVLLVTNSQPISGLSESFLFIGRGYIGVIPIPTIILVIVFIIGAFVVKYTQFGRNILAIGENDKAAELSGINVKRTKTLVFAIAGACTALGGIVLAARLGSGQPSSGSGASLMALAAVFVGGTSGGNVFNSLAGALLIGLINNGLNLLEVNSAWQDVSLGTIIVAAVAVDVMRRRKAASSIT